MKKYLYIVAYLVLCAVSVQAFNLSPFTWKLRSRDNAADSAFIRNDTMFINNMSVSVAAVLKAVALQADTLRGSSNIVGILDSALRIDPDSSSAVNVITFGGYGGGLRWNRATDKVQFTNDFSTWTDIGSGGSGSAGAEIHDSLDANWATFTAGGGSADSNAITYETDRLGMYSDTGLYLGDIGDSTMLWYDLTADNIKAYVILYYVDDISDSALMSKYWIETTIGDSLSANGFLTGLNSTNGISGGASQNIVNIQLDPTFFAVGGDTVRIQNLNAGKLAFNVFGSPTDYDELVITENTLTTRTIGSWRVVYTNGSYALAGATVGAANTVLVGNGTSSAPSFRALTDADIPNNITISIADSTSGGAARATTSKTADSTAGGAARATLASTVLFSWLYTFVDTTTAVIPRATLADSCTKYDTTFVDFTELRAEIKNRAEIYNKIDTTSAKIPTASLADSAVKYDTSFVDWTELRAEIKNRAEIWNKIDTTSATIPVATLANSVLFSWLYTFVDTTTATLPHATFADSANQLTHRNIKPWHLDTTKDYTMNDLRLHGGLRANWWRPDDIDSPLVAGGGQGVIIGSEITFGTDITDDSLVQQYVPEPNALALVRGWSTADIAYNDSMTIRGVVDSLEGNAIRFNDSTLTSGNHRRHYQLELPVPDDCDSLRRIIIRCKSGTYSAGTTEFFTVARLARRSFTWSLVDSAIGGSLLDKDSSAATSATDIVLSADWAVSEFGSVYLLISGRRDVGTVYNYSDVFEVRPIWHRTGL